MKFVWVFLSKDKNPPLHILDAWFKRNKNTKSTNNVLQTDQGSQLAGSDKLWELALFHGYTIKTTGSELALSRGYTIKTTGSDSSS